MIPTIEFSYMDLDDIGRLDSILLKSKTDKIAFDLLIKEYKLIRSQYNPNRYRCEIIEMLYSDIASHNYLKEVFDRYVKRYGYDMVSKLIVPDPFTMMKKVESLIESKLDKRSEIDIEYCTQGFMKPKSSIPEILYSTLKEHFEITCQTLDRDKSINCDVPRLRIIRIKKKEN